MRETPDGDDQLLTHGTKIHLDEFTIFDAVDEVLFRFAI